TAEPADSQAASAPAVTPLMAAAAAILRNPLRVILFICFFFFSLFICVCTYPARRISRPDAKTENPRRSKRTGFLLLFIKRITYFRYFVHHVLLDFVSQYSTILIFCLGKQIVEHVCTHKMSFPAFHRLQPVRRGVILFLKGGDRMDAQKFGAFIAEMRKAHGLTQAALAAQLHVTDKAVSRWERGLGFPDINTMEPLAAALGVTVLELMRSERLPEGAVSNEEASEAITDTLTFAQQRRASLFFDITAGLACLLCAGMTFFLFGTGAVAEILFFFGAIGVMVIGVHRYVSEASIQKRRYGAIAAGIACIFLLLAGGSLLSSSPSTSRYAALFMAYFFPVMLACWLMLLLRRVRAWLGGEDLIFWGDFFSTSGKLGSELGANLSPKTRSLINIAFAL